VRKLLFLQIEYIYPVLRSYPQVRTVYTAEAVYEVITEGSGVVLFILKVPELISIKTTDPVLGTEPEIPLVILRNSAHSAGGQPFRNRIVPEAYLLPTALIV
jgi:hypothetical protein